MNERLVGGLVAIFYFPRNIGNVIIPIDELIFFRGVTLAHQPQEYDCHAIAVGSWLPWQISKSAPFAAWQARRGWSDQKGVLAMRKAKMGRSSSSKGESSCANLKEN